MLDWNSSFLPDPHLSFLGTTVSFLNLWDFLFSKEVHLYPFLEFS